MTTTGDGRTLPWRFLGRQVRPYALAVSVACGVVFWSMITESGVGNNLDGPWGKAIGVAAVVLTEGASWPSGALAVCWVVASSGSWLLEVNDRRLTAGGR